jgi:hypothetical protein
VFRKAFDVLAFVGCVAIAVEIHSQPPPEYMLWLASFGLVCFGVGTLIEDIRSWRR